MSSKKNKHADSMDFAKLHETIEKGKKRVSDQAADWKGGSHKERAQATKELKRKKELVRHQENISWKKRAGGACAIIFLCGVGLFQFLSSVSTLVMGSGIATLEVGDTASLKQVLFAGDPWFIYCINNDTRNYKLPDVLSESAWPLKRRLGVRVGTLDCWEQTQSGRSVAQRFKLNLKPPLSFVVANGNKPRVLNLAGISHPEALEKRIKPALALQIYRIDTLKKWSSLCTSRRACVVIGHKHNAQRDTALNVLKPLQESNRGVKMVTLDTSFWQLKLGPEVMATRTAKEGRGADVLCLAREDSVSGGNTTHAGRFLQSFDSSSASTFLTACAQQADLVKLSVVPQIKARPSKPKKVSAPPPPRPRPREKPKEVPKAKASKVDYVGSREKMENEEEALFESVDEQESEGDESSEESEETEEADDEVEL